MTKIETLLAMITFVKWDRYTYSHKDDQYTFYGWIDRPQDAYKDFMLIIYAAKHDVWFYVTSSVMYDGDMESIHSEYHGGAKDIEYSKCMRIEDAFAIPNAIHLNKTV